MSLLKRISIELIANDLLVQESEGAVIVSREDIPCIDVFVSTDTDENIVLCSANIVEVSALKSKSKEELYEKLLISCPTLPLSSIGISNGHIIIYGQLIGDSVANVLTEVEFLFDNIVEVVPLIKEYV